MTTKDEKKTLVSELEQATTFLVDATLEHDRAEARKRKAIERHYYAVQAVQNAIIEVEPSSG